MDRLPAELQEEVFKRFFEAAEIAKFDPDKREKYISEMFTQDDYINEIETARENGEKKGRAEVAKALKLNGVSVDIIASSTGLSPTQIEAL